MHTNVHTFYDSHNKIDAREIVGMAEMVEKAGNSFEIRGMFCYGWNFHKSLLTVVLVS